MSPRPASLERLKAKSRNSPRKAERAGGEEEIVQFVRLYLRQVVTIQQELLTRLLDERYDVPLNLAEAFEDAANRLLDLSELISERRLENARMHQRAD